MQGTIWISFDLGIRGDYEGMYAWLDEHGAKECGDGLAVLKYECEGDLVEGLSNEIKKSVHVDDRKTRIYVIWRDPDSQLMKGRFILGNRKSASWSGYGRGIEQATVDEG